MKKRFYFRIILCIVLVLGIGYALITSNLSITGTSKLKGQTWDVYFANLTYDASSNNSASIDEDNTTIRFNIDLSNPGADYTFYFDVFNDGTLDAMLDTIEVQGIADELKKYLDITTSYVDGVEVSKYDLLESGEHETLKMNLKYSQNLNIDELPDENLDFNLALAVKYDQADNNAVARQHGVTNQVPPTVSENGVTVVDGNAPWKKSVIVSYNITDTDAIKNVNYCISNSSCTPNIRGMVSNNVFNYEFPSNAEEKLICMNGEDIFGNKSTTTCSSLYLVDKDGPEITDFTTTQGPDSITIDLTATDSASGIFKYYYSKDNGETFVSSSNSNYTFTGLGDATYVVVAYAEDIAGNKSIESTDSMFVSDHEVYAILYSDGLMVFNEDGDVDSGKTLVQKYNITGTNYTANTEVPWIADGNITNITTVDFEERTRPISTAFWFNGATNLTEVLHGSNLDTSHVTTMQSMFYNASNLTTLDVSQWNTENVTNLGLTFKNTQKITNLNVSNWDTSKVENMRQTFYNNLGLTTLDVSRWNTENVTNMYGTFSNLRNVTTLDLRNWNTDKVTDMTWMFGSDTTSNLTEVKGLESFNTTNVTSIAAMFQYCTKITSLNLSGWNTSKVRDTSYMFGNMTGLTSLNLNNWDTSQVTNFNYMFALTTNLTTLNISHFNTSKGTNMEGLFYGMEKVTTLNVTNWNVSNTKNMSAMFYNCYKLNGVDLSKWDTRGATSYSSMFTGTTKNASTHYVYYGDNSTNIYTEYSKYYSLDINLAYKSN